MNVEFALNILREAPIPMKNQEIFQVMKDQGFTGKKYEVRNFLWSLIDKGVKYRSSEYKECIPMSILRYYSMFEFSP